MEKFIVKDDPAPVNPASEMEELQALRAAKGPKTLPGPKRQAKVLTIDDIDPDADHTQKRWAWFGRLPKALCLLTAREGTGKSAMINWLATKFSVGGNWPTHDWPCEKGSVLLFDSEDGWETKLAVLKAMGADMQKVSIATEEELTDFKGSLAEFIKDRAARQPDLRFVSLDVCRDFDKRLRSGEDKPIEDALGELKNLALHLGITIMAVHHESKGSNEKDTRDRARGSTHWTSNCRVHWSMSRNEAYGPCGVSLETGKSNWSNPEDKTPMIFQFQSGKTAEGLEFGLLVFDKVVDLDSFEPPGGGAIARVGRPRKIEPDVISQVILDVLLGAGGAMFGRMEADRKEVSPGSEEWNLYACNVVSAKLKLSSYTVYKHWRTMEDGSFNGYQFSSFKSGARWKWQAFRVEPLKSEGDSND
jgi:hypothetical protein